MPPVKWYAAHFDQLANRGTDNNDIFWNLSAANLSGASGIATTLIPTEAIDQFSFVTSSGPI